MSKIKIVDAKESVPICPYCEKQLTTIEKINQGLLEQSVVYFCPHCKKVLGIGYQL
jgi:predicted SprT family Zn-dependent metalloprotease